jgi:hypothetical protein
MGEIRNAYKILAVEHEGKRPFWDVVGRIQIKCILNKYGRSV